MAAIERQVFSTLDNEEKLWTAWLEKRDDQAGSLLVEKYMPLVQFHVDKIAKTLPNSISKEELKSLALVGLYESLEKFDRKRDLKFETFANFRIRGAILDGLRKEDWLPRKTREKVKKVEAISAKLEQQYLRPVTPEEIATECDIPVEEIHSLLDDTYYSNILSIDYQMEQEDEEPIAIAIKDDGKTPEEEMVFTEDIAELANAISKLSEKEQIVLNLFYKEELTFTEIGSILSLTTSRISQIHTKAINKLRQYLQ